MVIDPPTPEPKHELVVTTHALGAQSLAFAEIARERALRRDDELAALWATDYGPLNRLFTLWSVDQSRPVRNDSECHMDWLESERLVYALEERRALQVELLGANLIELRMYATKAGRCEAFVEALTEALPYRERYSPCVALWTTRESGWDVAVHIWAYGSFEERTVARRAAVADRGWAFYRSTIPPLIEFMQAFLLTPGQLSSS